MAYQHQIIGTDEGKDEVRLRHSGVHSYLDLTLNSGRATVRIGTRGVRIAAYPDADTLDRAYQEYTYAQAGASTTWEPDPRELGNGHWLHSFQLSELLAWSTTEAQRLLDAIAQGEVQTEYTQAAVWEALASDDALYSSADVAAELGISLRRVQQLARSRGVGQPIGRTLVFRAEDINAMRDRPAGRPRKVAVPQQ